MRTLMTAAALTAPVVATAQGQSDMSIKAEAQRKQADARMTVVYRQAQAAMKAVDAQNTTRGGGFGFAATLLEALSNLRGSLKPARLARLRDLRHTL